MLYKPIVQGKIPFRVGDEAFDHKAFGHPDDSIMLRAALIVLHGGPGISHDYLPLADLVSRTPEGATAVLLYDQLGSGQSTRLPHKPPAFWTIDLFIAGLENVLDFFGTTHPRVGGTLAAELIVRRRPSAYPSERAREREAAERGAGKAKGGAAGEGTGGVEEARGDGDDQVEGAYGRDDGVLGEAWMPGAALPARVPPLHQLAG
ncbi:hypothetical protein DFH08DRAFT_905838 [Mycena albidolilacea]|uniref:Uncharacterized protein n=1 Tax=Mycena albidolilacea TaxID=1033008 RepID=A0AAD7E7Z9_9AGAR|nr:hypothetical protein DFH08DRAFT_905838 [Mycena albidolilacea]